MKKETSKEDNWFKQHEKVLLEIAARQREKRMQEIASKREQEELDRLREAHWMKCPKCGHDMETITLEGIDVENCTYARVSVLTGRSSNPCCCAGRPSDSVFTGSFSASIDPFDHDREKYGRCTRLVLARCDYTGNGRSL